MIHFLLLTPEYKNAMKLLSFSKCSTRASQEGECICQTLPKVPIFFMLLCLFKKLLYDASITPVTCYLLNNDLRLMDRASTFAL